MAVQMDSPNGEVLSSITKLYIYPLTDCLYRLFLPRIPITPDIMELIASRSTAEKYSCIHRVEICAEHKHQR